MQDAVAIDIGQLTLHNIGAITEQLQSQIEQTKAAQLGLNESIETLAELMKSITETPLAYDCLPYQTKLVDSKARVVNVQKTLDNLLNRLTTLQRAIAREIYAQKREILASGGTPPGPPEPKPPKPNPLEMFEF